MEDNVSWLPRSNNRFCIWKHFLNHIWVTEAKYRPQKPPNMVLYHGKFSQPYRQCPVWARAYVRSRLSLVLQVLSQWVTATWLFKNKTEKKSQMKGLFKKKSNDEKVSSGALGWESNTNLTKRCDFVVFAHYCEWWNAFIMNGYFATCLPSISTFKTIHFHYCIIVISSFKHGILTFHFSYCSFDN